MKVKKFSIALNNIKFTCAFPLKKNGNKKGYFLVYNFVFELTKYSV